MPLDTREAFRQKTVDAVNGMKHNDITLTFQNSGVMSAGTQSDIILKFEKADSVKVEGSKTTEV